jgi:hypothetical protein
MQDRSICVPRRCFLWSAATAVTVVAAAATAAQPADPFLFLQPVVRLSTSEIRDIDRGQARVRALPSGGREVTILAIVAANVDADRLAAWVERIEAMKKSRAVHAIQRFSEPPRLEDLTTLSLTPAALDDVRDCEPGDCGLKLSAVEMARLQAVADVRRGDWQSRVQQEFRAIVLDRVTQYRTRGHTAIPAYEDDRPSRTPRTIFDGLLERSRPLLSRLPDLLAALTQPPTVTSGQAFLYWSTEQYGGKPVLSVTDVRLARPAPDAALPLLVVAGKQVFAMHYMNGSLNLTMLLRGRPGGPNYLVYLNRSDIDVISGVFGGLARTIIERRVRNEAGEVLEGLRTRLQSGPPPR